MLTYGMSDWIAHTRHNTPRFDVDGVKAEEARVVGVHDGDTVKVLLPIPWAGGALRMVTLRLLHIDAPELSTAEGPGVRDRLLRWLAPTAFPQSAEPFTPKHIQEALDREVVLCGVECGGLDKYGRVLALLKRGQECVNTVLLNEGLARL